MYVLVTYDVSTKDTAGERRLRRVAKLCVKHGQRVQNSVFECLLEPAQYELLKHDLLKEMDVSEDSLRLYNLGKKWHRKVESFGSKDTYDPEGFLCI